MRPNLKGPTLPNFSLNAWWFPGDQVIRGNPASRGTEFKYRSASPSLTVRQRILPEYYHTHSLKGAVGLRGSNVEVGRTRQSMHPYKQNSRSMRRMRALERTAITCRELKPAPLPGHSQNGMGSKTLK